MIAPIHVASDQWQIIGKAKEAMASGLPPALVLKGGPPPVSPTIERGPPDFYPSTCGLRPPAPMIRLCLGPQLQVQHACLGDKEH